MAAPQPDQGAIDQAERLVDDLIGEVRQVISREVARAVEVAEDIWAEAESLRGKDNPS
jgi:vacuolar-type H+-ATPase subunit H